MPFVRVVMSLLAAQAALAPGRLFAQPLEAAIAGIGTPVAMGIRQAGVHQDIATGSVAGEASADPPGGDNSGVASRADRGPSLLAVTLASAVLPGAGQALLGSRRGVAYATAEIAGWLIYSGQVRDGHAERRQYRDLSRTVARAAFSPTGPGGNWDYYERLEKYVASGAYDVIPGGALDPEPDPVTYNGSIWLLARQTYWREPSGQPSGTELQLALAFYERRAVPAEMRWSWADSPEGFQRYRRAIVLSNDAFKRAEQTLGFVIANHVLSVVDAYVSVRLRHEAAGRTTLVATLPYGGGR